MSSNDFVAFLDRLNSFKLWKGCVDAEKLARAGLLFTGVKDKTICTVCKHEISDWKEEDDPWLVHYFKNADCPFIVFNSRSIQLAKDKAVIKNHLSSSMVQDLILSGKYSLADIKNALEYYLIEYNIIPQTINGVVYVTDKYLKENK